MSLSIKQVYVKAGSVMRHIAALEEVDQRRVLGYVQNKLFGKILVEPPAPREVQPVDPHEQDERREHLFWSGIDKGLEEGDAAIIRLYAPIRDKKAAQDAAKNVTIIIEHDEVLDVFPAQFSREALVAEAMPVDIETEEDDEFGDTGQGEPDAEAVLTADF